MARDFSCCWLAAPDIIDWGQVSRFRYVGARDDEYHHDICWVDCLKTFPLDAEISVEYLKRRYIECLDGNDSVIHKWSVYSCSYCEIEDGGSTFLLSNSRWYKIDSDFVAKVDKFYKSIERSKLELRPYANEGEGKYNKNVVEASEGACILMDQKLIPHGGGRGKIEFCDLMFKDKKLVHVKRYGAAASLSHLFMQGANSGKLFVTDKEFREKLNKVLPGEWKLANVQKKPAADHYEIVFAVISEQEGDKLTLPFFSRLTLKHSTELLRGYGFNVTLCKIAIDD